MIIDNGRLETEPGVKIASVIILGMEDKPPYSFSMLRSQSTSRSAGRWISMKSPTGSKTAGTPHHEVWGYGFSSSPAPGLKNIQAMVTGSWRHGERKLFSRLTDVPPCPGYP